MDHEQVRAYGYVWEIWQEPSNTWIGVCESLGIVLEGHTRSDLFECAQEAVRLIEAEYFNG